MDQTLANRNNNPGNIKDSATGNFKTFASPQEGYAALMNDLQAKMTGTTTTGLGPSSTLADFSKVYAPAGDKNDPAQYTANLANKLGVRPDATLQSLQPKIGQFAEAIAHNEGYQGETSSQAPTPPQNQPETAPTAHENDGPHRDWLDKTSGVLSSIFGGGQVGDLIGTQIAKAQHPEQAQYLHGPSAGQVAGDIGQMALSVLPLGLEAKGVTKGLGLAGRLAESTALGSGFGATQAMKDKGNVGTGALTGGALGLGLGGVGAVAGKLLNVLPRWFVGSALRGADESTLNTALEKRFTTIDSGVTAAKNDIDNIEGSIQKQLEGGKYPLTIRAQAAADNQNIVKRVIDGFTDRNGTVVEGFPNSNYTTKDILDNARSLVPEHAKLVDKLEAGQANPKELNKLRSAIDRRVASVYKPGHAVPPESKNLGAGLASSLRDYIQTKFPKTQPLFAEQQKNINLSKLLQKIQAKTPAVKGFGFRDIMAMTLGHGVAGLPGAMIASGANRVLQSPSIEMAAARGVQKVTPALKAGGLLGKITALKTGAAVSQ